MTDAAVEFLLDNLKQLLLYNLDLIGNARVEVEKMEIELRMFKSFLRDTTKVRRKNERVKDLVREIRDVVYEAEDIIDAYVTQATDAKAAKYFSLFRKPVNLLAIANSVLALNSKNKLILGDKSLVDLAILNIKDDEAIQETDHQMPNKTEKKVVGLEDQEAKIFGYLKEVTTKLDPISIVGMPGLGKTTITRKIYTDPDLQFLFPTRMWIYVSAKFNCKKVFLDILKEVTTVSEDMSKRSENELANLVYDKLQTGNFLIVLDDIWAPEDWDALEIAFPRNIHMGKILITSRNVEVGRHANSGREPHELRLLTHDEGWLLLQYEVFGEPEFPPELDHYGKIIVRDCGRLPLAIVVAGGILSKKPRRNITEREKSWKKVSDSVAAYLNSEDTNKRMENIIALSYDKLPYHLRACFLYTGIFPEDFEIPASKLICMWIAEGFIQKHDDRRSLEEIAENYLEDLINRNLLIVEKMSRIGKVKTCRIHDMLREFCRNEGGGERENFLQEVKKVGHGSFSPESIQNCRRLCMHHEVLVDYFSSKRFGPSVRSFVCVSKDEDDIPSDKITAISAAFKLLRVLEVKPLRFSKLPSDLYKLVHLKYIVLSVTLSTLPPAFDKLLHIQTLIVNTTSPILEVKADIWKMIQLTHFKTNASATLPKPGRTTEGGVKIHTLGTISPTCCNENMVFDQARNLKKVGIRGQLKLLFDENTGSFRNLGKLESVESLKLINDVHKLPNSDGKLGRLSSSYHFPAKLKRLTLSKTHLDWAYMRILGLLENLEVLKLKENAFIGDTWQVVDGGFHQLRFLYIQRTNLTSWKALSHNFPRLRSLELKNCDQLLEIPSCLADIPSFKILDLHCTPYAAGSATRICAEIRKKQEEKTANIDGFKLSIFPPYNP